MRRRRSTESFVIGKIRISSLQDFRARQLWLVIVRTMFKVASSSRSMQNRWASFQPFVSPEDRMTIGEDYPFLPASVIPCGGLAVSPLS